MTRIQNGLLYGFGVVLLVSSGVIVYMQFFRGSNAQEATVPAQLGAVSDGSLEQYASKPNPNTKQPVSGGLEVTDKQSATSPIPAASSPNNAQQQNNKLLNPTEFEQYEQYANASSTVYQEVLVGNGVEATAGATATVVYTGWLTNGQIFDQSRKNDAGQIEAFSFQLGAGQVIRGWEEGVNGMKVGGKRRLIIPSALGYGEAGQGPIPPNAMLVFDVELVQVTQQ